MAMACASTANDPAHAVIKSAKMQDFSEQTLAQKEQSAIKIQDDIFASLNEQQVSYLAQRGSVIWEGCGVYTEASKQYYFAKGDVDRFNLAHLNAALYENMYTKLSDHPQYRQSNTEIVDEMRGGQLNEDQRKKALVLSIGCSTAIGLSVSSDDNTLAKIMSSPVGLVMRSGGSK